MRESSPHIRLEEISLPEIERFLLATKDIIIAPKNYGKYIVEENIDSDTCSKWHQDKKHIKNACKIDGWFSTNGSMHHKS